MLTISSGARVFAPCCLGLAIAVVPAEGGAADRPSVVIAGAETVIFEAGDPISVALGSGFSTRFTPTLPEATAAVNVLRTCMSKQKRKVRYPLSDYRLQIYGVVGARQTERRTWINAFRYAYSHDRLPTRIKRTADSDRFPMWRREPVLVHDGGDNFFNALVDLGTNTCEWFRVNGEA